MTRRRKSTSVEQVLELLCDEGLEAMAEAVRVLLNEAMKLEREEFLGAKSHERNSFRRGYANGYKAKRVKSRLGELDLQVPQVRDVKDGASFYPRALERGMRSERALKVALAEMYVKGVSTRKVAAITEKLCGFEVTSTQVSRAAAELDEELEAWRNRPLGRFPYLVLDARYEKVRHGPSVVSCAVLMAAGIDESGQRHVVGVSVKLSEAEVHWREFLSSLAKRGLHGVEYILSDDHEGLRAALRSVFPAVAWQRCQVHLQRNAAAYVTRKAQQETVRQELRVVFNAPTLEDAWRLLGAMVTKYEKSAPRLSQWLENAVPEGFAAFSLPLKSRTRLRSTNLLERLSREIKRRTQVVCVFPNEASVLRLVSALLLEVDDDWTSAKRYLPK